MKKRSRYILAAAILGGMTGGAIFRDLYAGPVFGVFVGLFIALMVIGITTLLQEGPFAFLRGWLIPTIAGVIAFSLPLGVMKMMFDPPVWLLTQKVIANPPPASLADVQKHIEYAGPENRYLLKFHISPDDVAKIVKLHGMVSVDENSRLLATYQDEPAHAPAWWDVSQLQQPAVYRATVDAYQRVLIYDTAHQTGYLLVFPAQPIVP